MPVNKSCTNCPGATDHDTAHCPLFLLRERFRLNEELPPKWYALVLQELDAFTAELRDKHPEQAEGAQGERDWETNDTVALWGDMEELQGLLGEGEES